MKKRDDGRWERKITIGGVRISFYSIEKTERAAFKDIEHKIDAYHKEISSVIKFGNIAEEWLHEKKSSVGGKTYITYTATIHKLTTISGRTIQELYPSDFQAIINDLHVKGYGKTILLRVRSVISMIYDYAISKNIITYNNAHTLRIPAGAKRKKRDALSDEEIAVVLSNSGSEFGLYPVLLLYTGLRRGEALALQWKDIDFTAKKIKVTKAVEFSNNQGKLKAPKSQNGIREVPLLDVLSDILPTDKNPEDYVFGGNRIMSETMIRKRWAKYLKETGLSITQHMLRHTYATILYRANIDPKTAQALLGHSDVSTTLDIYTHISNSVTEKAKDSLNNLLKEVLNPKR